MKQTHKVLLVFISTLLMSITAMGVGVFVFSAHAATPPSTMNFQGRLKNSSDTVVADGLYNMQFRIYSASSGGSALWTETRQETSRVQVTNGLFSTQLGEVNPLPASLFNASDLYFEITMATPATATCSTASCATWESPMTPRNKLATSAYAFNAATLNGFTEADFAAASGSTNYIQNTDTVQTANFNILGTGTAGTIRTANLDTATATALTIGGTNATSVTVAKDMTIAASKTISMIGGATNLRPASPSEGTMYFDTDKKQLMTYANGKWQADRSTATVIVGTSASGGASGAVASKNPEGADFVNTSTTSAQTVINQAIASLPTTGGNVYLMEGTYIVDSSINIPNNTTLVGSGGGTIVKVKNAHSANINVLTNSDTNSNTSTKVSIQNLVVDGNKANQTTGTQYGILFSSLGGGSGSTVREGGKVSQVTVRNMYSQGVRVYFSSHTSMSMSVVQNSNSVGAYVYGGSHNIVTGNTIQGNGQHGVEASSSGNIEISNNQVSGNGGEGVRVSTVASGSINGNMVMDSTTRGISLVSANNVTISGNTVVGGSIGIYLYGSDHLSVSGNTLRASTGDAIYTTATDFSSISNNTLQSNSGNGIRIDGESNVISDNTIHSSGDNGIYLFFTASKNTVSSNRIHDSGGSSSLYHGIRIYYATSPTDNSLIDNHITDTAGAARAISVESGSGTLLSGNRFGTGTDGVWHASGPINDAGTGTIYANQIDGSGKLVTRSSGGFAVQNTSGNDLLNVSSTTSLLTVSGDALYKNLSDSATAFVVQDSTAQALFTVNTQTSSVTIGSANGSVEFGKWGITFSGAYRPNHIAIVSPEYPGATFRGDGTNNTGTLTSDFCSDALNINPSACPWVGDETNYYEWTTSESSTQDYDLYVTIPFPSNTTAIDSFSVSGFATSITTDDVQVTVYYDGWACATGDAATTSDRWTVASLDVNGCGFGGGDKMVVKISLSASQNNFARVGDIQMTYRTQR